MRATIVPKWVPKRYVKYWVHPWYIRARRSRGFKKLLIHRGYLSPHFTIREAGGQDRHPLGTELPVSMYQKAQTQAFRLERLRHRIGDKPVRILSWYRNTRHNAAVGGVVGSQHLKGTATDHDVAFVNSVGASRFDKLCNWIWALGGFGKYPSGSRHTDSRGRWARW